MNNGKNTPPRKTSAKSSEKPNTVPLIITAQPAQSEELKEKPKPQPPALGLTIAQAVELRQELTEDVASLNWILDVADRREEVTGQVILMVETKRNVCQMHMDRLNDFLEKTVLPL